MSVVLLNPEVWGVDEIEMLFHHRFNIVGNMVARETALCIERVGTDTEGTWFYELELKADGDVHPANRKQFPSFVKLLEYLSDLE